MDIRIPIGLLFSILGAVLGVYGLTTFGSRIYDRSLGTNVNMWSGACLLIFGASMLTLALRAAQKKRQEPPEGTKGSEAKRT